MQATVDVTSRGQIKVSILRGSLTAERRALDAENVGSNPAFVAYTSLAQRQSNCLIRNRFVVRIHDDVLRA